MKSWNFTKTNQALVNIRQDHTATQSPERDSMLLVAIHELFGLIKKIPYSGIRAFGAKLTEKQFELFERYLSKAPDSSVLAKTVVLFYHYRKSALSSAFQYFVYGIPPKTDMGQFKAWVVDHGAAIDALIGWTAEFYRDQESLDPLSVVTQLIETKALKWRDFEDQSPGADAPLFSRMCDLIFTKGDPVYIPQLRRELAHELAEQFLHHKDTERLSNFLSFYPNERWEQGLLEAIALSFGPPDPAGSELYRILPQGVLWSFRKQIFQNLLHSFELEEMRKHFWKNWIHHCTNIQISDGIIRFNFGKLMITEHRSFSVISYGDHGDEYNINFGPEWERKLNQNLNEYLY